MTKNINAVLLFSIIALNACQCKIPNIDDDTPPLPPKIAGASDISMVKLQQKIIQQGAKIITAGQDYLIIIPSTLLFADESPKIEWSSYSLLNDIACYLQQFRKISIHINAYSVPCGSIQREYALTTARAESVGNYLWSQGIESRFIFTQGKGSSKPIVALAKAGDQSFNSRIEITFWENV